MQTEAGLQAELERLGHFITNVARRGRNRSRFIYLKTSETRVKTAVYDNGAGIPKDPVDKPGSFGFPGLRVRFVSLGGELTLRGMRHYLLYSHGRLCFQEIG